MQRAPTVVITEDHPLFVEALDRLLNHLIPGSAISTTLSFTNLLGYLRSELPPDLILLDLNLPDAEGFSSLAYLRTHYPNVRVAIVSGDDDPSTIEGARSFGASGYLIKTLSPREFEQGLAAIVRGEAWFPELPDIVPGNNGDQNLANKIATLSPQQYRILCAIADGLLNKQIAYDFGITEGTVKGHVSAILRHLGLRRRTQVALAAQRVIRERGPVERTGT